MLRAVASPIHSTQRAVGVWCLAHGHFNHVLSVQGIEPQGQAPNFPPMSSLLSIQLHTPEHLVKHLSRNVLYFHCKVMPGIGVRSGTPGGLQVNLELNRFREPSPAKDFSRGAARTVVRGQVPTLHNTNTFRLYTEYTMALSNMADDRGAMVV